MVVADLCRYASVIADRKTPELDEIDNYHPENIACIALSVILAIQTKERLHTYSGDVCMYLCMYLGMYVAVKEPTDRPQ